MISRWQSGTLLSDLTPDPATLVPYVETLHRGLPPCSRRYDPLALAREHLSIGEAAREIVELAGRSTWSPPETTACHNDLNPWNIIRPEAGEWVTLDWEWLGDNDPLFDLVTLHQGLSLDDALMIELAEELLGASVLQQRVRDCLVAFWLREYAWAHAELTCGNDRSEIREQIRLSSEKLAAL
jgi:thiamine kinase-like enzyme